MPTDVDRREAPDVFALASEIRVIAGRLTRTLRAAGGTSWDLTRSQLSVLGRLERDGPATASDLARADGIRSQSMASIVAALELAGYVTGSPDPTDGRKTRLSLTGLARERFAGGRLAREDWLFRVIQVEFSESERAELSRSIDLLRRLADHE